MVAVVAGVVVLTKMTHDEQPDELGLVEFMLLPEIQLSAPTMR